MKMYGILATRGFDLTSLVTVCSSPRRALEAVLNPVWENEQDRLSGACISTLEIIEIPVDTPLQVTEFDEVEGANVKRVFARNYARRKNSWDEKWLDDDFRKEATKEFEQALRERLREDPELGPTLLREIDNALHHKE